MAESFYDNRDAAVSKGGYSLDPTTYSDHFKEMIDLLNDMNTTRVNGVCTAHSDTTYDSSDYSHKGVADAIASMAACTCDTQTTNTCECDSRVDCSCDGRTACECNTRSSCSNWLPGCICNGRIACSSRTPGIEYDYNCTNRVSSCSGYSDVVCGSRTACTCDARDGICECVARCPDNTFKSFD